MGLLVQKRQTGFGPPFVAFISRLAIANNLGMKESLYWFKRFIQSDPIWTIITASESITAQ